MALKLSLAVGYRATSTTPTPHPDREPRLSIAALEALKAGDWVRVWHRGRSCRAHVVAIGPAPARRRFGVIERDAQGAPVPDLGARPVVVCIYPGAKGGRLQSSRERKVLCSSLLRLRDGEAGA